MEEIQFIDLIKRNPHSIYDAAEIQMHCSLELLHFGKYHFNSSYIIENLKSLNVICENSNPTNPPKREEIEKFVINSLMDSIKISICFENFGKSILLAKGYLIHIVNKDICPELSRKQKKEPIYISELINFLQNRKKDKSLPNSVVMNKVLLDQTINYGLMLKKESYFSKCLLPKDQIELLKQIHNSRNQLHLANSINFKLRNTSFQEYNALKNFVNNKFNYFEDQMKNKVPNVIFSVSPTLKIK